MTYRIRIQETRLVTLEVKEKPGYTKEQITALVQKRKDGLSLRSHPATVADKDQPLKDDAGNVVGRYGELKEEKSTREILRDDQNP